MNRIIALILLATVAMKSVAADTTVYLSDLRPIRAEQAWGALGKDKSVEGTPLTLGGQVYAKGIGTHAQGRLMYYFTGKAKRFTAWVGIDDEVRKYSDTPTWKVRKQPSSQFKVVVGGKTLFDSGVMRYDTPPKQIDIPLNGAQILYLITDEVDGDNYAAHADWADAQVTLSQSPSSTSKTTKYTVASPKFTLNLSADGRIVGIRFGKGKIERCSGANTIAGLTGPVIATKTKTGMSFTRKLPGGGLWTETYTPHANGIRWATEVKTMGKPWSSPFETAFTWSLPKTAQYWTAWGGPYKWEDPLEPKPIADETYEYGAFYGREGGISLPLVTLLDPKRDLGVTLVQSPEDKLIDMQVQVTANGGIHFVRLFQRYGEGRVWRASMDILAHEADFRPALGWMVSNYRRFFEPGNPLAQAIGGHGAYSGYEGNLDAAKLKQMGFTFNWKASIDFPYMGMFIPPIPVDVKWNRFAGGGGGGYTETDEGRFGTTSALQLEDYSKRMKAMGFHVLNYFNVTEFGGNIQFPKPPSKQLGPANLWKNANDFMYTEFPNAMLLMPNTPIGSWGGTVVMDPGDKAYQDFLISQAHRHIKAIPDSDGICIDRMDWLVLKNPHADDGLTWVDGPQRSLYESWHSLMKRLMPLMHRHNKVIFGNAMIRRPDLTIYLDGIYDEHGDYGYNLNTSAYLCLLKPNVAWTRNEDQIKPDPDGFMQRFLYMGCFMSAPVPGNDHTLLPSEWADKLFADYGPLFNALKAREWVLKAQVVEVKDKLAQANVFKTPEGYVVVVAFGGDATQVQVKLNGLPAQLNAQYLSPGVAPSKLVSVDTTALIDVPLIRGCAVLKLTKP